MQAKYSVKVQVIRSKNRAPSFYVNLPLRLAAAIGLQAGEAVEWELLDRGELHRCDLVLQLPGLEAACLGEVARLTHCCCKAAWAVMQKPR